MVSKKTVLGLIFISFINVLGAQKELKLVTRLKNPDICYDHAISWHSNGQIKMVSGDIFSLQPEENASSQAAQLKKTFTSEAGKLYFSDDRKYIAVVTPYQIKIYKETLQNFIKNINIICVHTIHWAPNNKHIVIIQEKDQKLIHSLYNVETGDLIKIHYYSKPKPEKLSSLNIPEYQKKLSWSPKSNYFAKQHYSNFVQIWNIAKNDWWTVLEHENLLHMYWLSEGTQLLTVSENCAKLWDIDTGTCIKTITFADFMPKQQHDNFFIQYNASNGELFIHNGNSPYLYNIYTNTITCLKKQLPIIRTIQWSPHHKYVAIDGGHFALWDVENNTLTSRFKIIMEKGMHFLMSFLHWHLMIH